MPFVFQTSFYDYSMHFLPVQFLNEKVVNQVFALDGLFEDIQYDCITNDLSREIGFLEETKMINTAEIQKVGDKYQIHFYLPFCQFVWSVGIYLVCYFDNCVQIPLLRTLGKTEEVPNNQVLDFARYTFDLARSLHKSVKSKDFFVIPNIADMQQFESEISIANAVYLGGMAFVFAHEFSHNYLGHTHVQNGYDHSIDDEIAADNLALSYMSDGFMDGTWGDTYKTGIAVVLSSLLLMGPDTITGGGSHPHMDYRIESVMSQLHLPDYDIIWGLIGSAIRMWLLVYGDFCVEEDMSSPIFENYSDFYKFYLKKLEIFRSSKYPDYIKPSWDI